MRYFFIVNPNSRNCQTGRLWPAIERRLKEHLFDFEYKFTSAPLDAIRIAEEASVRHFDIIVSVGGDGTNNEVINGVLRRGIDANNPPAVGFIPQGTGGDFRRSANISTDLDEAINILKKAKKRRIDTGEITFINHSGERQKRYFVNICSLGISGLVDHYVNHTTKIFGGKISFIIGTIRGIFNYKNIPAEIIVDGTNLGRMNITLVAVANGRYFGGSMMIAPKAELDDGVFDIIIMKDITRFKFIKDGPKVYKGEHLRSPEVIQTRGREILVKEEGLYIDLDGEDVGRTPSEFRILPASIDIITP